MKRLLLPLCFALCAPACLAATALCESDREDFAVSLISADDGRLLDLALTQGDSRIYRFSEAKANRLEPKVRAYRFSANKTREHPAVDLDIRNNQGKLRFLGHKLNLSCAWN